MNSKFSSWRVFSKVKGSFCPIYTKKYYFLSSLEFFENENFNAHAPVRAACTRAKTPILDF